MATQICWSRALTKQMLTDVINAELQPCIINLFIAKRWHQVLKLGLKSASHKNWLHKYVALEHYVTKQMLADLNNTVALTVYPRPEFTAEFYTWLSNIAFSGDRC